MGAHGKWLLGVRLLFKSAFCKRFRQIITALPAMCGQWGPGLTTNYELFVSRCRPYLGQICRPLLQGLDIFVPTSLGTRESQILELSSYSRSTAPKIQEYALQQRKIAYRQAATCCQPDDQLFSAKAFPTIAENGNDTSKALRDCTQPHGVQWSR